MTSGDDLIKLRSLQLEMASFVSAEFEWQRKDLLRRWQRPLRDRVASGHCIEGLAFEKRLKDGILQFSCGWNESRFREGDLLRLHRGKPSENAIDVVFYREEDQYLWFQCFRKADAQTPFEDQRESWIVDPSFLDLEGLYLKAIEELGETERGRERILPILAGTQKTEVDLETFNETFDHALNKGMNEKQAEAIGQCLACNLTYLVQGPPGTGKTRVLAHVVAGFLERGERVLITSHTHRAIHHALNQIVNLLGSSEQVAKIGLPVHDPDLKAPQYANFKDCPLKDSAGGYIIGATPFALRSKRLKGVEFETVLFDEASQVTIPLAIMAMLSADRYLFIGDHQQMPPVVHSRPSEKAVHASIFGYLKGRGFDTMLDTTYRMNEALTTWPSAQFYHDRLQSHESAAKRRLALPAANGSEPLLDRVLDPEDAMVFVDVDHEEARHVSLEEAQAVAEILVALHERGLSLADVGVVTPFRMQARAIRQRLRKTTLGTDRWRPCVIDTVERMQGQEREVVVLSLVTSDRAFAEARASFLFQPQRLNVSVTRPRSKLIVVGSSHLLGLSSGNTEVEAGVDRLRSLLDHATRIPWPSRHP